MSSPTTAGLLQTHTLLNNGIVIKDEIYGETLIHEPILLDLLQSPELLRLKGIHQHGVTGFLYHTPQVTRLEHSVGAFLLVRKLGATLEEQIAALLHDISHTTLSHVIDHALSKPGEDSYHEVHKMRYIGTTLLPEILARHGIREEVLEEELFSLVEMPAPRLCADRLDYALRDTVAFGKLKLEDAKKVVRSLNAYPNATATGRFMVLDDPEAALTLSRAYMAVDKCAWSNPAHIDMYQRTGRLIHELVEAGSIDDGSLWKVSDAEFWAMLREKANPEQLRVIDELEGGLPEENGLGLPHGVKIRTLDPDIWQRKNGEPVPLSTVLPSWGLEREEYIASRK